MHSSLFFLLPCSDHQTFHDISTSLHLNILLYVCTLTPYLHQCRDIPADKNFTCFEHLFVFVEEAFWIYNDIYRQRCSNLPSFSLKEFADQHILYIPLSPSSSYSSPLLLPSLDSLLFILFLSSHSLHFQDSSLTLILLQYNASLLPFYHGILNVSDFDQMTASFADYKRNLPRYGACLLNKELDSVSSERG